MLAWQDCGEPGIDAGMVQLCAPGGDVTDSNYTVGAVSTSPTYGGRRWWWLCPLNHRARGACNRRVGKLYLPSGASYFGCRHCYELSYTSAQEHDPRVSRLANDPMALYLSLIHI